MWLPVVARRWPRAQVPWRPHAPALSQQHRECVRSSRVGAAAAASLSTRARPLTYVASDEIDDRLLRGLRSADDDALPVNLIQDKAGAQRVLEIIRKLGPSHFHACDTEVADIDIKAVGPVGNGKVTCLSLYSGPDVDYGNGPYVWIDNLDSAEGTLEYFRCVSLALCFFLDRCLREAYAVGSSLWMPLTQRVSREQGVQKGLAQLQL
ncbi:hypothetical protein PINS_up009404 [Pythium insidiosum]|nr:hypothetical protein PINS_up009404 [Pythium insidiosum]